jgi:hypothetical protein
MKEEDLEIFASAAGLRRQMSQFPGELSQPERVELLDRARHTIARECGMSLDDAHNTLYMAAEHGDIEVRCGAQFAAVIGWGRVLHCATRHDLRGAVHPELN